MLKFAASGVISVPQNPASIPIAATDTADKRPRPLLQTGTFQNADGRQHQPSDTDEPVLVKRLAERGQHLFWRHPRRKPGHQRGSDDDQQRIVNKVYRPLCGAVDLLKPEGRKKIGWGDTAVGTSC